MQAIRRGAPTCRRIKRSERMYLEQVRRDHQHLPGHRQGAESVLRVHFRLLKTSQHPYRKDADKQPAREDVPKIGNHQSPGSDQLLPERKIAAGFR